MYTDSKLTGLRPSTFLLAALSLSIGWGIRGNFGHEYGAMIPGALTAIAVCLLSGRSDWRERVAYFGMFGALGWGFGGSISYMQVIGYTHSGDALSQYYGFFCLFVIGFLWGGMGGAGTAFPAVVDKDRLTAIFRPLVWVIVVWIFAWIFETWLENWSTHFDQTWKRQESGFYWLDADWFAATTALLAMCLYDLWNRRFRGTTVLLGLGIVGAAAGWLVQGVLTLTGLSRLVSYLFVWPQGDIATLTRLAQENGTDVNATISAMIYNWPNFLMDHPQYAGCFLGAVLGAIVYFRKWGQFRDGASLFVYMGAGWLLAFIAMPVLLGFGGAGLRMTPPRGDDWAGIVGVFFGTMLWLRRNHLVPVVYAAFVSGIVGGLGFAGAAWLKLMLMAYGNKELPAYAAQLDAWQHWQRANWHSFLEQSYGFINGLGIALAMGLLARKAGTAQPGRVPRPWTEIFAASWVFFGVGWINIQKNVTEWTESKTVPEMMKAPLFGAIELSANTWFAITFWLIAACVVYLMFRHMRRPIAVVPDTALGKGQLFYLVFLWVIVIANFERALPGFSEQRLLTEWVITVNAALATVLVLVLPNPISARVPELGIFDYHASFSRARWGLVAVLLVVCVVFPMTVRARYEGAFTGHAGKGTRFGADAAWRTSPILKGQKHE